jgi:hypothetical protein
MTTDPNQLGGFSFDRLPLVDDEPQPSAEIGSVELEPFREFEFDLRTQRLRVAGYSTAEVTELLVLYREHMKLLAVFAEQNASRQQG